MEAGFIPASLYAITTWYKTKEMSVRFAIFFFGNYVAQAASGLIAYGVLHMRGVAGLTGWQWLFIVSHLGIQTLFGGELTQYRLRACIPSWPVQSTWHSTLKAETIRYPLLA